MQHQLIHDYPRDVEDDYPGYRISKHQGDVLPVSGAESQRVVGYQPERLVERAQHDDDDAEVVAGDADGEGYVVFAIQLLLDVVRGHEVLYEPRDCQNHHAHDHIDQAARYLLEHVYECFNHIYSFSTGTVPNSQAGRRTHPNPLPEGEGVFALAGANR